MKIKVKIKNVYGEDLLYVEDEAIKENISSLTGCKTLRRSDVQALEFLGHTFEVVTPSLV